MVLFNIFIHDHSDGTRMYLQQVCTDYKTWRSCYTGWLCCHPEWPQQAAKVVWWEPHQVQQEKHKVLPLRRYNRRHHYIPGPLGYKAACQKRPRGSWWMPRLNMRQQWAFVAKKLLGVLAALDKQVAGCNPSPPLSPGEARPGVLCPVLGSTIQETAVKGP